MKTTGGYVSQNLRRKSGVKNTPDTEDQHGKYIKVYIHTHTHIYTLYNKYIKGKQTRPNSLFTIGKTKSDHKWRAVSIICIVTICKQLPLMLTKG